VKSVDLECFYSLFESVYKEDYFFPGEAHDFWEMVYVREGAICVSADERIFHLSAGDIIFHKPKEFHKFYIENNQKATLLIMSFSASGKALEHFKDCVMRLSKEQGEEIERIRDFLKQRNLLSCLGCNGGLRNLVKQPDLFQRFFCMMELWFLSLAENRSFVGTAPDTSETIAYRNAVQTMERSIQEWLSVEEIARECAVSVSFLKKVFAKYAGLGIHQYFLRIKIVEASRMLKEGKSVAETSAALAFSSPNYFSTVYKRETGVSPFVYKNMDRGV